MTIVVNMLDLGENPKQHVSIFVWFYALLNIYTYPTYNDTVLKQNVYYQLKSDAPCERKVVDQVNVVLFRAMKHVRELVS